MMEAKQSSNAGRPELASRPDLTSRKERGFILRMIASVIVLLVLAQGLAGVLAASALARLVTDLAQTKVEVVAGATLAKVESAMRFGKTLGQFIGLRAVLAEALPMLPEVDQIQVYLANGQPLNLLAETPAATNAGTSSSDGVSDGNKARPNDPWRDGRFLAPGDVVALGDKAAPGATQRLQRRPSGAITLTTGDDRRIALPIHAGGTIAGWAVFGLDETAIAAVMKPMLERTAYALLIFTAGASTVLGLALWLALRRWHLDTIPRGFILALPLVAVVLGQAIFAVNMVSTLREVYVASTRTTVETLASGLQRDIDRLITRGIELANLSRIEEPLGRLVRAVPQISAIRIEAKDGRVLHRAGDDRLQTAPDFLVELPLGNPDRSAAKGHLVIVLNAATIAAELWRRVIDSATVALVSAVIVTEMFLIALLALSRRQGAAEPHRVGPPGVASARESSRDASREPTLGRAFIALFVFAWALPLSFLTLHAGDLPARYLAVSTNLHMALPISAEMLCALVTALIAGRITDQRGWQLPVIGGLTLCLAGAILATGATGLERFILARALVGAGYGFTWIGIQAFVVRTSVPTNRAENLARLVAGIYSGHLAGSAVGAMLAEQFGYTPVFATSVALIALPLFGLALTNRHEISTWVHLGRQTPVVAAAGIPASDTQTYTPPKPSVPQEPSATLKPQENQERENHERGSQERGSLGRLIGSRDFGTLLIAAVIPFSIVQVGLLYFALPVQLSGQGVAAADIGRVLMLYGLTTIFLGPTVARIVDRSSNKKIFIPIAGLAGGGGLLLMLVDSSIAGLLFAVTALAVAGAMTQAAQASYALGLDIVKNHGLNFSFSLQRAADKFGQMLGPLVVGALMSTLGGTVGLAVLGVSYACFTLLFFLLAPTTQTART